MPSHRNTAQGVLRERVLMPCRPNSVVFISFSSHWVSGIRALFFLPPCGSSRIVFRRGTHENQRSDRYSGWNRGDSVGVWQLQPSAFACGCHFCIRNRRIQSTNLILLKTRVPYEAFLYSTGFERRFPPTGETAEPNRIMHGRCRAVFTGLAALRNELSPHSS